MVQKTATRCAEQLVREPGVWPRWHPCTRKGVVSEDGNKWCKQHAPSSVKARREASSAKFKADQDRRLAPYNEAERLRVVNAKLLSALEGLTQLGIVDDGGILDGGIIIGPQGWAIARDAVEAARP
jgi:hypothetical protein